MDDNNVRPVTGPTALRVALRYLHYVEPFAVGTYFVVAKITATCFLQKAAKKRKASRRLAIGLLAAVITTIVAQAAILFICSSQSDRCTVEQDFLVYLLLLALQHVSLAVGLIENQKPLWHPYFGTWVLTLPFEVACTTVQALVEPFKDDFSRSSLALQVLRVLLLLCLATTAGTATLGDRVVRHDVADESEPLLRNNDHAVQPGPQDQYGSLSQNGELVHTRQAEDLSDDVDFDSDCEDPEEEKKLQAQRRQRLQASGSWLAYISDFKIFIPMLWPSRNRRVQAFLAIVVVVLIVERFLNVLGPRQLGNLTNELTRYGGTGVMPWRTLGIYMLIAWLRSSAGLSLVKSLAQLPIQYFVYKSIGTTAFRHIMYLSMDFHTEKSSGELIRAIEQGQHLEGLLEFVCFEVGPMFMDLIVGFVYVTTLFDIYMALILAGVGLTYIWIGAKTTTWSVKQRRRFNSAWRTESKVQNEAINNWQTVSHFNRGAHEFNEYSKSIDEFTAAEWAYFVTQYLGGGVQSLVMLTGRLAAFTLAVYRVAQGVASLGDFITLTAYWIAIEAPLSEVSWSIRRVSQMLTDSERLLQLMMTKPTVSDTPNARELNIKEGRVEFDHVDFAYDIRRPVLKDVSFEATPGQTVALVGETGGGKSTVLKLLYRYYDATGGSIRIDGHDIRDVTLDSLRDSFGMVPQDPALFNTTLMHNLKYARLDATDEEVIEACKAAAIHDKIESFPDKYQSKVGERGVRLSGGEMQRVAIARAILRQPKIVLLDEATSMIDAETEELIQSALKRLTAGRTTFIIAHRLSTIQHADLILVINDGQIIERGMHEELFRQNGKYAALWSRQRSKDVQVGTGDVGRQSADQALIDLDAGIAGDSEDDHS